jgi:hypothetical protein
MKAKILILILVLAALTLTACAKESTADSGSPEGGTTEECPLATTGTQLLTNADHGYCLLYPTGYDLVQPNPDETVILVGSLLDVEHPKAFINVQDAAGRTAAQVADEVEAGMPGFAIQRGSVTIGGEEAVVLDNVPGQDFNRQLVVVHDGRLYKFMFVPADPSLGDLYARMEELYSTMINSFEFTS